MKVSDEKAINHFSSVKMMVQSAVSGDFNKIALLSLWRALQCKACITETEKMMQVFQ